jgi:hypothetical protein
MIERKCCDLKYINVLAPHTGSTGAPGKRRKFEVKTQNFESIQKND